MMRKKLSFALASVLAISIVGCGQKGISRTGTSVGGSDLFVTPPPQRSTPPVNIPFSTVAPTATSTTTTAAAPAPTAPPAPTYRGIDIRMGVTDGLCDIYNKKGYFWQWGVNGNAVFNAYRLDPDGYDATVALQYTSPQTNICYEAMNGCLQAATFSNYVSGDRKAGMRLMVPDDPNVALVFRGSIHFEGKWINVGDPTNGFVVSLAQLRSVGKVIARSDNGVFLFEVALSYDSIGRYSMCRN